MPTLSPSTDGYAVTTSPAKLIKRALRIIGVIDPGEDLEAEELRDGLEGFNHMVDSWNTERLVIPSLVLSSSSQSDRSFTIGPGGDHDIYRPSKLEKGQVFIELDTNDYELESMTSFQYGTLAASTATGRPCAFYYDCEAPVANLYFDITPDQAYTVKLFTWKLLAQIATGDVNGNLILPPGYARAIVFNLALDLADEWGGDVTANMAATANTAKANLKSLNSNPVAPDSDPALLDVLPYFLPDITRGY